MIDDKYPPIADYALISDCHCVALVSRTGSIDWSCMPRIDSDSCFGRLLDWGKGGHCAITPTESGFEHTRRYLPQTMVLETRFRSSTGEVNLTDCFAPDGADVDRPRSEHIRVVDGIAGETELRIEVSPRFDYGEIHPAIRRHPDGALIATGSNKALVIWCDRQLDIVGSDIVGTIRVGAGERVRLVIRFEYPELVDAAIERMPIDADGVDRELRQTCDWWSDWASRANTPFEPDLQTLRSALTLKALTFERTGAIAAAATTSLPESIGGERNWDYRYSWVRDSVFTVRALHRLGYAREADRFHDFIKRSSAGNARELQVMVGVDGNRRLSEIELDWLEGYRQSKPVRIGNGAAKQTQLDIFGELLEMSWEWHAEGRPTDPDYWQFLAEVADCVCERWRDSDHGIWEVRKTPLHYVHSQAMCWAALNRAILLARENGFDAPLDRWTASRDLIRATIEREGVDEERGIFIQAYENRHLDSAVLLLPRIGLIDYDDPRMIRTVDALRAGLERDGLLLRYDSPDNLAGQEGAFLPCTFWLVGCLAHQRRFELAWRYYERALRCANDVGLFSEEFDPVQGLMLGNFPQGLTHVSQIMARLALAEAD